MKSDKLPKAAYTIFHIPQLSGSGVAYFFAKEIFEAFLPDVETHCSTSLQNNFAIDYLVLAAIGAIADLVPVVGASRSLVKHGLAAFSQVKNLGIRHILKDAGIEGRKIGPYEVGFMIAPRINAVGRLEHAIDALRLLCTKKSTTALELAQKMGGKNKERQDLVEKALKEAIEEVERGKGKGESYHKIITLVSEKWHEGIIGLIAGKLTEKYNRPAIVMTKVDGFLKGSARSVNALHITNFLRDQKQYLIDVGGHKQASGFAIEEKNLKQFLKAVETAAKKSISDKDLEKEISADFKMGLNQINLKLVLALEDLVPYGIGNPQPTFYSKVEIIAAKIFGSKQNHLKMYAKTGKFGSFPMEFIAFSGACHFPKLSRGKIVDLIYKVEVDRWGGNERIRGIIIHLI